MVTHFRSSFSIVLLGGATKALVVLQCTSTCRGWTISWMPTWSINLLVLRWWMNIKHRIISILKQIDNNWMIIIMLLGCWQLDTVKLRVWTEIWSGLWPRWCLPIAYCATVASMRRAVEYARCDTMVPGTLSRVTPTGGSQLPTCVVPALLANLTFRVWASWGDTCIQKIC